jgi:hypothetical protein
MSLQKQLSVNRLPLPTDMLNTIKDYCFYNIDAVTKKNKKELIKQINSADVSRANRFNDHEDYSDEHPLWSFGFYSVMPRKVFLEGLMCLDCGDYIHGLYRKNVEKVELIHCFESGIICKCSSSRTFREL